MNRLKFIEVTPENMEVCNAFRVVMRSYSAELDFHQNRHTPNSVVSKWSESIINLQGEVARHLELCFDNTDLIGFLYGKIDRPHHKGFVKIGYGYIMEFFVLPKYRRKGYGTKMYYRLETLLRADGAKCVYLTADPVTGKPFWEYLGFTNTGKVSSENGLEILEKELPTIQSYNIEVTKQPSDDTLRFIADKHGEIADKVFYGLKNITSKAVSYTGYFCVILRNSEKEIIGYADFIQSSAKPTRWFYTDLWVSPEYRLKGNGKLLVKTGLDYLNKSGADVLLCNVDPENEPSINLQKSLGFKEIKSEPFEFFDTEGLLMFEKMIDG